MITTRMQSEDVYDVIVVGGGPGGATAATFIAMDGHKVLLLEREKFPRYQIGESLLPTTVHGICKMLGVSEAMETAGFTRKRGGTFRWGLDPEPWTFAFGATSSLHGADYAYQVERSKFDALLLDNARNKGVAVREQCKVSAPIMEGDRIAGIQYQDDTGTTHTVRSRYVIDASGNQSRLNATVGERSYSKFFQNVALFGYFENGKRLPPPNNGNILCAAFDLGWFWYIPLSPTLTSVGAVIGREHADKLKGGHEEALLGFVDSCPLIKEYLAGASRVREGVYGELRVRKDYSYCHDRFWKPGIALVGDAACFIDPVFSSGVHLATYSALLVARSVNSCLRGTIDEPRAFGEFEQRYRREYGLFYDFLVGFYDMKQSSDSYYWNARTILNTDERSNEAFVRLVAGAGTAATDFFRDRQNVGQTFEKMVGIMGSGQPLSADDAATVGNMMTNKARMLESRNLVLQANAALPLEKPMFDGGLIPSPDGFSWLDPAA